MPRHALGLILGLAFAAPALAQQGVPGERFLEVWDLDQSGEVTLEEMKTQRGTVFSMFDTNEDDILDAEEYSYFDEARANDVGAQAAAGGRKLQRLANGLSLAANDADGDGQVTRAEFIAGTEGWRDRADRNGDGVLSAADFGPGR
ncbi:hypothetical protein Ga0609869_001654 [Rhodovulum iodosum]|uniref:EF-hand domain-containing protein n=1 Tax=Rhodovulum iodosum TaxID=68291 RepID=A0ABV3XSJ2_9RHOB|nr:EF-hand domain-containing protein [Rhodovulum robiginosum]RSK30622.1 EF-hand domain-containing protein [Rhodovulum robiginosum]